MLVASAVLMAIAERVDARETVEADRPEECAASIRSAPSFVWHGTSGRGYEEGAPAMWQEGIVRVEVSSGTCAFMLVVDAAAAVLDGPSGSIDAVLSDAPGGTDLARLSLEPSSTPFSGSGSAGEVDEFAIFLSLPPGQPGRAGDYAGLVPVRLFVMEDGLPVQIDETTVDMSVTVGARLSVSAPGFAGGSADVDLGDISEGFERMFVFDLAGNSPVSVSLASLNSGSLMHEKADVAVPYSAMLQGRPVDLRTGPSVSRHDLDPSRTQTMTLEISGGRIERPVAGVYRDTLTITFRSEG
jgi:hypothetical protein